MLTGYVVKSELLGFWSHHVIWVVKQLQSIGILVKKLFSHFIFRQTEEVQHRFTQVVVHALGDETIEQDVEVFDAHQFFIVDFWNDHILLSAELNLHCWLSWQKSFDIFLERIWNKTGIGCCFNEALSNCLQMVGFQRF